MFKNTKKKKMIVKAEPFTYIETPFKAHNGANDKFALFAN